MDLTWAQWTDGSAIRVAPLAVAIHLLGLTKDQLISRCARGSHRRVRCDSGVWLYEVPEGMEVAGPKAQERGGWTAGHAYVYDSRNKAPRYLIRNGPDGAIVNQLASRVHAIAYSLADPEGVAAALEARDLGAAPRVEPWPEHDGPGCLVHLSTRDVHVGEPGAPEAYEDEIAPRVASTLEGGERAHGPIACAVVTLGSDWLTVDNAWRQTTRGTQLPGAASVYEGMRWAEALAVRVVELCRSYARRTVGICEQGNHDAVLGAAMARTCRAWFRHCEDVEIQIPACGGVRTYYAWEDVLLVGHHGHIRKPSQLPPIVAAERPALWGAARWRYLLLGHRHHSQRWAMGDLAGCEVIQTRSPSRPTEYEHRLGFTTPASLESFVFLAGRGLVTHRRA